MQCVQCLGIDYLVYTKCVLCSNILRTLNVTLRYAAVNQCRSVLSPVHTNNNVEATFDFVEATFDFVAKNGNDVERVYRKISSLRQSRNKLNTFSLFRLCRFVERIVRLAAFDNVASTLLPVWTGIQVYRNRTVAAVG